MLKIEQRRYTGDIIPTTTDDKKRFIKLKRGLETTRKNVILADQQRKKVTELERKAEEEKTRMAACRAKVMENLDVQDRPQNISLEQKALAEKARMIKKLE